MNAQRNHSVAVPEDYTKKWTTHLQVLHERQGRMVTDLKNSENTRK